MEGKPDTEDAMRVLIEGAMAEATHQCCRNSEKGEMGGRWGRGGKFWKATVARARRETGWWVMVAWRGEATSLGPGMLDPTAWRSIPGRRCILIYIHHSAKDTVIQAFPTCVEPPG